MLEIMQQAMYLAQPYKILQVAVAEAIMEDQEVLEMLEAAEGDPTQQILL